MAKVTPVCGWLLDHSPNLVRKLTQDGPWLLVGDMPKWGLSKVRLEVPEGISVYHVNEKLNETEEGKRSYFFTARESDPTARAYLSIVKPSEDGGLNYMQNVGVLLHYPWYNHEVSSFVFSQIGAKRPRLVRYARDPEQGKHPFSN